MAISLDYIQQLCLEGESNHLDYKREQYLFIKAADSDKEELLKDILAMANAFRSQVAYILIGVEQQPDGTGIINGITKSDFIDDAKLQQFVYGKTNRPIEFHSYSVPINDNAIIQVIEIPVQKERPYCLRKQFGSIDTKMVPLRVGSSTNFATPDEIAKMGKEEIIQQNQREIEISLIVPQNPIGMIDFSSLDIILDGSVPTKKPVNVFEKYDLFRPVSFEKKLAFVHDVFCTYRVDIALENKSPFSAEQLAVETSISQCSNKCISRKECFPERPSEVSHMMVPHINNISSLQQKMLHPGQCNKAFDSQYFYVNHNGDFTLEVTVLGKDMQPVRKAFHIQVQKEERHLHADQIEDLYEVTKNEDFFIHMMALRKGTPNEQP